MGNQALDGFAIEPERQQIVSIIGNRLSLWETGTATAKWNVVCEGDLPTSPTISPDGQTVAVALDDSSIRFYRATDGREVRRIPRQPGRAPIRPRL
jgi:WD40 repeat protein